MTRHPYAFAAVLAFTAVTACSTSPTGRRQLVALPESQMEELGSQAFGEMKQKQKVATDPKQNQYVSCIANAIIAVLPGKETWEVVVFQDDSANAFALPGRKIGVHTGLLKIARTQDQLAAVIGHEVGHVLAHHGNERASQELAAQGILVAGATVASTVFDRNSTGFQVGMAAVGLGAQYGVLMPFGRAHESEADVIGLDLMSQAGFNPQESVTLWRNMAEANKGEPPQWLSTHPSNATRIQGLQEKMPPALQKYQAAQAAGRRPNCRL